MGVGYQVSALHDIHYLEPIEGAPPDAPPPSWLSLMPNTHWDGRPTRFVSPRQADIVAWRDRMAAKYRTQLGEDLTWDEGSDFSVGAEAATGWDLMLKYVAAVIDQEGAAAAARLLKDGKRPARDQYGPVFDAIEGRGFMIRFPHLLLNVTCWLPFQRHMIIEEPNWRGTVERFGSTINLMREIAEILHFIGTIDPAAAQAPESEEPDVLAAAWKAADIIHRFGTIAVEKHLPFWTTG